MSVLKTLKTSIRLTEGTSAALMKPSKFPEGVTMYAHPKGDAVFLSIRLIGYPHRVIGLYPRICS